MAAHSVQEYFIEEGYVHQELPEKKLMRVVCELTSAASLWLNCKGKCLFWCLFCRSEAPDLATSNAAAGGGRHPLPVSRSLGTGPGAPPPTPAEVAQASRSH